MAVNEKSKANAPAAPGKTRRPADDDYEGTAMSLTGIRGHLAKSVLWKAVLGLLIFIFAVGFALTATAPNNGSDGRPVQNGPARVAVVDDQVVDRSQFENSFARQSEMMAQFGQKTDVMGYLGSRQRTLEDLVSYAAQYDAAVEQGMVPGKDEITAEIDKRVKEALKNQEGENPAAFRRQVEAQFGSVAEYEQKLRENLESQREGLSKDLAVQKLKKSVEDKNKVTEADYKRSVTKLDLYQITVRPKPVDPVKDKDQKAATEKNKADAKAKAEKLAAELKDADVAKFKSVAQKESDDFATKSKGGAVGWKLPSEISAPQPVKDAVEAATGKIAGPVEDEWTGGWVIYYINGRKEDLPKDYAKKKSEFLKTFETTKDGEAWTKYIEELKKTKSPEILDPAVAAYQQQQKPDYTAPADQQKQWRQDVLAKYQEALGYASGMEAAAIHYQMSTLYQQDAQPKKAIESLQTAVKESGDASLRIQLANQLQADKRTNEALEQLKQASKHIDDNPSGPSMFGGYNPDDNLRNQIAMAYDMMGKKDLAAAERKKIKPTAPGGSSPFNITPQIQ